jgi:hypothetical protein
MTKFASIWGELSVGSVSPKEEKEAPARKPLLDSTPDGEEDKNGVDAEEDEKEKTPAAGPTPPPGTGEEEEEEGEEEKEKGEPKGDVLTFTDDDIAKAYTMLLDEGVLDLTEEDEFEQSTRGIGDAVAATVRNKLKAEIASIPPTVQEYYAYVMEGNDPNDWKPTVAMSWADADHTDPEVQKAGLKKLYLGQGMTSEEADEEIADAIAADKLAKKSGIAIATLIAKEAEADVTRTATEKAAAAKAIETQKKDVLAIEKTIDDAPELAGFKLDDKKRQGFKDYLFKVNPRTGKTQMQMNMASDERRLTVAWLDYVNYSKADLEKEISDGLTRERKKKLARFTDKNLGGSNSSASVTTKIATNKGKVKFPTIFGSQSIETED